MTTPKAPPDELRATDDEVISLARDIVYAFETGITADLVEALAALRRFLAATPDEERLAEAMFYALEPASGEYHGEGEQRSWSRAARTVIAYLAADNATPTLPTP